MVVSTGIIHTGIVYLLFFIVCDSYQQSLFQLLPSSTRLSQSYSIPSLRVSAQTSIKH